MTGKSREGEASKIPPTDPKAQPEHPPPEEELGGGDFCSLEEQPSTEDDKPLD